MLHRATHRASCPSQRTPSSMLLDEGSTAPGWPPQWDVCRLLGNWMTSEAVSIPLRRTSLPGRSPQAVRTLWTFSIMGHLGGEGCLGSCLERTRREAGTRGHVPTQIRAGSRRLVYKACCECSLEVMRPVTASRLTLLKTFPLREKAWSQVRMNCHELPRVIHLTEVERRGQEAAQARERS